MARLASASAASSARTFEIQRISGGRWMLDTVSDDKQIAINLANALLRSGRAPMGVQVVAVMDAGGGRFKEVQVYRATPQDQPNNDAPPARTAAKAGAKLRIDRTRREIARDARSQPANAAVSPQVAAAVRARQAAVRRSRVATLALIGIALVWCSIFYLWRQPQTPWAFDSSAAQHGSDQPNSFESKFRNIFSH
jgi:hypothetical protein